MNNNSLLKNKKLITWIGITFIILITTISFLIPRNNSWNASNEKNNNNDSWIITIEDFTQETSFPLSIYNKDKVVIEATAKLRMPNEGNTGWFLDIPALDGFKWKIYLYPDWNNEEFIELKPWINKIDKEYNNNYYIEWIQDNVVEYYTVNDNRLSLAVKTKEETLNEIEKEWSEQYNKLYNFNNEIIPSPFKYNKEFYTKYKEPYEKCINEIQELMGRQASLEEIAKKEKDCKDVFEAWAKENTEEKKRERMQSEAKLGDERWDIIHKNYISDLAWFGAMIESMGFNYKETLTEDEWREIQSSYQTIIKILEALADDYTVWTGTAINIYNDYEGNTPQEKMVNALRQEVAYLDGLIKDLLQRNKQQL